MINFITNRLDPTHFSEGCFFRMASVAGGRGSGFTSTSSETGFKSDGIFFLFPLYSGDNSMPER